MGGSISSLHRLRHTFLISLYKNGYATKTNNIRSIFESIDIEVDGVRVVEKSMLIDLFGQDSSSTVDELFDKCRFQNDYIPQQFIVHFLENGLFTDSAINAVKEQMSSDAMYPELYKSLGLLRANSCSTALTEYNDEGLNINGKEADKKDVVGHPIWKKHETVIQEKIVKQVTIDAAGNINELITTDKSQNDIIHIESKLTGEFAHREFTQQEQKEVLDKEVSNFIRATEEYIHLKSSEDEYEYLHSEIPPQSEKEATTESSEEASEWLDKSYSDEDSEFLDEDEVDYSL